MASASSPIYLPRITMQSQSIVMPSPTAPVPEAESCCSACDEVTGSTFAEVWEQVKSDPYAQLPHTRVTLGRFFRHAVNQLARDGRRTLSDPRDLLPRFDKLIRPNGMCLSGTWRITRDNPYTGYFASGSRALIVARASVGLSSTDNGQYRAFGMAGKLYPTADPAHATKLKTANFFVIDDNGGTLLRHYADAEMSNSPRLSPSKGALLALPVLVSIAIAQRLSDSHAGIRQLYPIARLGLGDRAKMLAPRFMMIRGAPGRRIEARDFRDQLRVRNNGGKLSFEIHVRDDAKQPWQEIGEIEFTDDAISDSRDHRLHFSHPRWEREAKARTTR
jgi:hypothetical protein